MKEIIVKTHNKNEMIDITRQIEEILRNEKIDSGILTVFVPHTTAGVTINEGADPDVKTDILNSLNKKIPENENYKHMEGNSDAHIKSSLIGSSVNIIINNGGLVLGTWQHVFFFEGDGPRSRKVFVEIMKK